MASDRIGRDLILVLLFVSESSRVRGILYVTSHIPVRIHNLTACEVLIFAVANYLSRKIIILTVHLVYNTLLPIPSCDIKPCGNEISMMRLLPTKYISL